MNISIISPGKFKKKPPLEELFNYYKKRINLKIDLKEIKTFNFEEKKKLLFEKNQITKHLKPTDYVVVLDKDGKMLSSKDFSVFLKKKMLERTKRICFLIGSELGLDLSLKKSCHIISLGRKTWPHLMVRIMLIEQIYRSLEIIKNSSYHK
ncbi:23S rRNA (pseudouridine(1915)-N(3))-methyltransferase RlmH [Alphaproteobacteria bacterium]|jgi:23S rRNA (pseudouridine1915-N3)-methyltransferase|nr:23S rRNA (pseudouridine(1915)-N(3))-methyltransferase RlmH [Alphaproteobacteria bacterium]|tara:strand:+ start:47 stop:499 length:453 start_codon:yes stop_codon:yes gene_type:complete